MRLALRGTDGNLRQIDVPGKIREGKTHKTLFGSSDLEYWEYVRRREASEFLNRHQFRTYGDTTLMIWKMPAFDLDANEVDSIMTEAKGFRNLIIDMRENDGGHMETLNQLFGHFLFEGDTVATSKERTRSRPMTVEKSAHHLFAGNLILIIGSQTASAAEMFARVLQLRGKAVIVGDRSAGVVQAAKVFSHNAGTGVGASYMNSGSYIYYGSEIPTAEILFADGNRVEGVGVTPDLLVLPTAEDIAEGRDVALSMAAEMLGLKLTSREAGMMFPVEWR